MLADHLTPLARAARPRGVACLNCGATVPPDDRWYLVTTDGDLDAVNLCDECWIEEQIEARCAELDRE